MAVAQIGSPCSPMELVIDDPALDLVEKTKGILLSLLTTLGKVESEVYSESLLVQFEEHLQELDHAIENSVGTATAKGIFEGLQSGLEKFSDYLYRITKKIQNEVEYSLYRKSLFLISAGFVCWVHHSKEIRSKLLTSGLLYSQIGAIEILNKNLQHKDALILLSLHFKLLFKCFVSNHFRSFYAYSGKNWYKLLSPALCNESSQDARVASMILTSQVTSSLTDDRCFNLEVKSDDFDCILGLSGSDRTKHMSLTLEETLVILQKLVLHTESHSLVTSALDYLLALLTSGIEPNEVKALCKLLLIVKCGLPMSADELEESCHLYISLLQPYETSEDLCLSLYTVAVVDLFQGKDISFVTENLIEALFKIIKLLLFPSPKSDYYLYLSDILDVFLAFAKTQKHVATVLAEAVTRTDFLESFYKFGAKIFDGVHSSSDELVAYLTAMFQCVLCWSKSSPSFSHLLIKSNFLAEHMQQLESLSTPDYTWFIRFLVLLNLAVILSCVQYTSDVSLLAGTDWSSILFPWLNSKNNAKVMSYLIYACACPNAAEEELIVIKLTSSEIEYIHDSFITAAESADQCSCTMFDSLITVSLSTLIQALKKILLVQKELTNPNKTMTVLSNIILNGTYSRNEVIATCEYLTVLLGVSPQLLKESDKASIVGALENIIQHSEDFDLKHSSEVVLAAIHGHKKLKAEASSELQEYSSLLSQLSLVLANDYSEKHDELCSLLTQLWKAYHNQSSSDAKHGLADYAASTSAVKELCHCICNIIKNENFSTTLLQCLNVSFSILTSWSDVCRNMRHNIMETEVLLYIADFINSLSAIRNDEMEVIKRMVSCAAIVLSNCAQEKEFGWFYTSPQMVDWSSVLENWMASTFSPLRFTAKLIAGYMSHVLPKNRLSDLLTLSESDKEVLLQMLYQSVVSESLTASGFGGQFTTHELIKALKDLINSQSNFGALVESEEVLPSLLLFLNSDVKASYKTQALKLLLMLSKSTQFLQALKDFSVLETVSEVSKTLNDPCFEFLCKCSFPIILRSEAYERQTDEIGVFYFCDASGQSEVSIAVIQLIELLVGLLHSEFGRNPSNKLNMSSSNTTHMHILEIIQELYSFWTKASCAIQVNITGELAKHLDIMDAVHEFILKAYKSLTIKKDNLIGPCFVYLLLCVVGWLQKDKYLSQHVLRTGKLISYASFHQRTSMIKESNVSRFILRCQLMLLLVCVQQPEVYAYFKITDWFNCLSPLSSSDDSLISLLSKLIYGHVMLSSDEETLPVFKFTSDDAQYFLEMLCEAARSDVFHKHGDFKLSLSVLLCSLNWLLACTQTVPLAEENVLELKHILLAAENLLPLLLQVALTADYNIDAKLETYKLLYYMLHNQIDKLGDDFTSHICEIVTNDINACGGITRKEFNSICKGILLILKKESTDTNAESCLIYANVYYSLKWWNDCIETCDKIKDSEQLMLLKGKALFHLFLNEQRKLKMKKLSVDVKKMLFEKVYSQNREIIFLFGKAFDGGYLDDEASAMFDRLMMDCIFEANMLDKCYRCYCCRQNLKMPTIPRSQQKLISSHIISRSILEEFASSLSVSNKQVLFVQRTSIGAAQNRAIAPKELAYYMLCHRCEGIISTFGETQFLPEFFRKVYSKESDLKGECHIEYGPWLHQFCISLLFRALHWGSDDYVNSEAIYDVFKYCQAEILNWSTKESNVHMKPDLYIFITPLSVDLNEKQYGYMNWFLSGGLGEYFGHDDLSSKQALIKAGFFVVHFGCINVFVNFNGKCFHGDKFSQFRVNPSGGIFKVPKPDERKSLIPPELWSFFRHLSNQAKRTIWEISDTLASKSLDNTSFDSKPELQDGKNDIYGIKKAMLTDAEPIMTHLVLEKETFINFLPKEFSVRPQNSPTRKLILPKGHHLLLHANYVRGPGEGSTFFIATGTSGKYPVDKPYVLWHFYDPGSHINCGAFFDVETLQIKDFLLSDNSLLFSYKKGLSHVQAAKERMPKILDDLLRDKGFSCMTSLLLRVKTNLKLRGTLSSYDTKCRDNQKCWYCRNLCQNCCKKPAAYGRFSNTPEGIAQLCSDKCQALTPEKFEVQKAFVISQDNVKSKDIQIHCGPVDLQHQIISHVYVQLRNQNGFPCEIEVALCVQSKADENSPKNRPYVVFYSHHLFHQRFAEFFINTSLLAEEPLPSVSNQRSWELLLQLNEAQAVRKCFDKCSVLDDVLLKISIMNLTD